MSIPQAEQSFDAKFLHPSLQHSLLSVIVSLYIFLLLLLLIIASQGWQGEISAEKASGAVGREALMRA